MTGKRLVAGFGPELSALSGILRLGWVFWLAVGLLFVYSIPHVIVLRSALTLGLLVMVGGNLRRLRSVLKLYPVRIAGAAFVVLLVWMLCVAFFISDDPIASLRVFVGEWGRALLALLVGCGTAFALNRRFAQGGYSLIVMVVFIASVVHMIGHDIASVIRWAEDGALPRKFSGITSHRANITFVFAYLLAVLGADIWSRIVLGRVLLPVGPATLASSIALGFFALLTASTTNGWIVSIFLVIAVVILVFLSSIGPGRKSRRSKAAIALVGVAFVMTAVYAVINDKRYEGFLETVEIAWDTESNREWLDGHKTRTWPLRSNGKAVDPSTYSRVAWAKEGFFLLLEHPLGTEINKHTFPRMIEEKYGVAEMAHAHIGILDFGLNVGFPGIALWTAFLIAIGWLGFSTAYGARRAIGLALFLSVLGFSLRMLIDSTLRDHILEQFMFCTGLLATACALLNVLESDERAKPT